MTDNGEVPKGQPEPRLGQIRVDFEMICDVAEVMNDAAVTQLGQVTYSVGMCAAGLLLRRYAMGDASKTASPADDIKFVEAVTEFARAYNAAGGIN